MAVPHRIQIFCRAFQHYSIDFTKLEALVQNLLQGWSSHASMQYVQVPASTEVLSYSTLNAVRQIKIRNEIMFQECHILCTVSNCCWNSDDRTIFSFLLGLIHTYKSSLSITLREEYTCGEERKQCMLIKKNQMALRVTYRFFSFHDLQPSLSGFCSDWLHYVPPRFSVWRVYTGGQVTTNNVVKRGERLMIVE